MQPVDRNTIVPSNKLSRPFPSTSLFILLALFCFNTFSSRIVCAGEVPGVILIRVNDSAPASAIDSIRSISNVQSMVSAIPSSLTPTSDDATFSTFSSWRKIRVTPGSENVVLHTIQALGVTQYAYRMRRLTLDNVPQPDSLTYRQWALTQTHAFEAWQVTTGSPRVLLGVIDTGVDTTHPDLVPNLWINPNVGQHGFAGDIHGWNFVDNNNDLHDVYGHGTEVSGCALAAANHVGIIGLAPDIRLMILRAGDENGFLDEDNVAAALIYASENGCRVVNMSFGDDVVAPLLRDAVEYARSRGMVLVASAGNSGDMTEHYPSGYEAVISVGASERHGFRASFSTYGSTLALLAPGADVITTEMGGGYGSDNGTSFSAPYVSAAAALVLTRDSTLNPSEVKTILCVSADDGGDPGWDVEFGHGLLNAARAVNTPREAEVRILSPSDGTTLAVDTLTVSGTAAGPRLVSWSLSYGSGNNPTQWHTVRTSTTQLVQQPLGFIHVSLADTIFTIRLIATVIDGNPYETRVVVTRDVTSPNILRTAIVPALVSGKWGWRFEAKVDDQTRASIQWMRGGIQLTKPFPYIDSQHALAATPDDNLLPGDSIQFVFTNLSGMTRVSNTMIVPALPPIQSSWPLIELPNISLPNGNLLGKQVVWNSSNRPDVLLNVYNSSNAYDSLWLFEWQDSVFARKVYYGRAIAQDAHDVTGDGIPELMIRVSGITGIHTHTVSFDSITGQHYPDPDIRHTLIPRDTLGSYGAGLFDFDPIDHTGNFIQRRNNTYEAWTIIWNNPSGYTPILDYTIHNPVDTNNGLGRPRFRIGNIIGSGSIVGLWGDVDGNIILSRRITNPVTVWQNIWNDSLGEGDATDYLDVGDYDGDGIDDFVAGYQTASRVTTEHEAPLKKWVFYLYRYDAVNRKPVRCDSLTIDGANDPRSFDAGVESGDIDGDGKKEIFISASPYLLVMSVDATHHWRIVYQAMDCRSNTVALFNVRNNGRPELVYNTGTKFKFLEWGGSITNAPLVPSGFVAQPLDTAHVQLSWNPVSGATSYRLIRSAGNAPFDTVTNIIGSSYLDSLATDTTQTYHYAVAAYDPTRAQPLGAFTATVSARPNHAPVILSAQYEADNFIRIIFSEPINPVAQFPNRFRLGAATYPVSVLPSHEGAQLLLRFDPRPDSGNYVLTVGNITDFETTPLSGAHAVTVSFPALVTTRFFLSNAKVQGETIVVTMSLSYDVATLSDSAFQISPNIVVSRADAIDSVTIRLTPSSHTPIGSLGVTYQVTVLPSLHSRNGVALDPNYASRVISTQPTELQSLFIYPNPARPDRGEQIVIAGLPSDTKVNIYSLSGMRVKTLISDPATGSAIWDGTNGNGAHASSGIYLIVAQKGSKSVKGKVAIVR